MWCLFNPTPSGCNWLERLPAGSISTWEDFTTHFLAQFFLPRRTIKLCNDNLVFQQHQGESLSKAWTRFKNLLQKVPHHGIDIWLQVQIFYDHVNPATRRTIDQSAGGKLRDRNSKESCALLEDLALYDNESWNDPRDFTKLVKAISLPQDVLSTSDRRLIELENQVQCLMEAHLAPKQHERRALKQSKESKAKEEGRVKPNAAECNNHKRIMEAKKEVGEKSEEELEEETEEEKDDPEYLTLSLVWKN
ncbi:zinc finger, CCHC-type containing protein [Tanacetum coccineum]